MSLRFRLLALDELAPSEVSRWVELSDAAREPNVYADPRWFIGAARLAGEHEEIKVALVDEGGPLVAALPLRLTRSRLVASVPIRVRVAGTEGDFFGDWGSKWHPVLRAGRETPALRALLVGLRSSGVSMLRVSPIPAESVAWASCVEAADAETMPWVSGVTRSDPWARADDPAATGEFLGDFEPNFRLGHRSAASNKKVGRYARVLERELGEPLRLTVEDAPDRDDEFLALQAAGWKGDVGNGGLAYLALGFDGWFRETAAGFRRSGAWRILRLGTPSAAVYMAACVELGGRVHGIHDAFDERFRAAIPGTLGRIAAQNAIVGTGRSFDPGLEEKYEEAGRQFPDRLPLARLTIATGGTAARAISLARRTGAPVWV